MTNLNRGKQAPAPPARVLTCTCCGDRFLFTRAGQEYFEQRGWPAPKRCPACRREARAQQKTESAQIERKARLQKNAQEQKQFERLLTDWPVISMEEIRPEGDCVLYIIGNGFDLMHGVQSSYYAFRDSLGKRSALRQTLETYLTPEDIWADFEGALAQFNLSSMGSQSAVDNWLDWMDAYSEDAGAAEFSMAVEAAATPMQIMTEELPRRFRTWVETLSVGTEDRPLKDLFKKGKVLCFNYTEFVETLYGIPEQNVCYLHGCRKKQRHSPQGKLILGHLPGASDSAFAFLDDPYLPGRGPYRQAMSRLAQEQVLQLIADYDKDLTKDCKKIIATHAPFFSALKELKHIVVIGHSFSPVDWDYFAEIAGRCSEGEPAHWYFGCHSLRDLQNLDRMLKTLGIDRSNLSVFRTDKIHVVPTANETAKHPAGGLPKEKLRGISPDRKWAVKTISNWLYLVDQETQTVNYEVQFSTGISRAVFFHAGAYLAVIVRGADPGVFLFRLEGSFWQFVGELECIRNQGLLNPRLRHIFLTDQDLTFVYNNRVRRYSLSDGSLISNQALRNADRRSYEGEEISARFLR